MLSILVLSFFMTGMAGLGFLGTTVLYCMGYALLAGPLGLDTTSMQWWTGAVLLCMLCIFGSAYVVYEIRGRRRYRPVGPFKQYIIDKHNKVCSLIEFKD
jgi:hypothetical protein